MKILTAGLLISVPVDYRYGWNLNDPKHLEMIYTAQQVLHMAPDCGPWSVSGDQRPAELRLQDRLHNQVALRGVQWLAKEQANKGRVYNIEHPLVLRCGKNFKNVLCGRTRSRATRQSKGLACACMVHKMSSAIPFRRPPALVPT